MNQIDDIEDKEEPIQDSENEQTEEEIDLPTLFSQYHKDDTNDTDM